MALTKIDDRGLTTPIDLLDNEKIRFGTGNDLEIYHSGSHSFIKDSGTGDLVIQSNTVSINNAANSENIAKFIENGAVELYYDNSQKLATDATGIFVNGALRGDSVDLADSKKILLGSGDDLEIYHDGTNSIIDNSTGELRIQTDGAMRLMSTGLAITDENNSDTLINAQADGAVELYYDNVKKFNTNPGGIKVIGNIACDGDNQKLILGAGDDLQIYHNGNHSFLENTTGDLYLRSDDDIFVQVGTGNELAISAANDGAVSLYYDSSKKFETTSAGAKITGALELNAANDTAKLTFLRTGTTIGGSINTRDESGDKGLTYIADDGNSAVPNHVFECNTGSGAFEVFRIQANKNVKITDGNLIIDTAGHGIDFSATSDATGKTSEILDDYEEGTFTPTFGGSSSESGQGYNMQVGSYTKIGNLVTIRFSLALNDKGSTTGTYIMIKSLPFTAASSSYGSNLSLGVLYFANLIDNWIYLGLQLAEGTTAAYIWGKDSAGTSRQYTNLADFADNFECTCSFTYVAS